MKDAPTLRQFYRAVKPYYTPLTYRRLLRWAVVGALETWGKVGRERYQVVLEKAPEFLTFKLELSTEAVEAIMDDLQV